MIAMKVAVKETCCLYKFNRKKKSALELNIEISERKRLILEKKCEAF